MTGQAILERIIEEGGSCTWAKPDICAVCPLGRSQLPEANRYMSCVESINIDGLSEQEADAKYLAAAKDKLADLTISDLIEAD